MREVFSRIEDRNIPLYKRQLFMLSLETPDAGSPGEFVVRESRSRWDEKKDQIVWEEVQKLCFRDIQEARLKYADSRLQLGIRGFQSISTTLPAPRSTTPDGTTEAAKSCTHHPSTRKSNDESI